MGRNHDLRPMTWDEIKSAQGERIKSASDKHIALRNAITTIAHSDDPKHRAMHAKFKNAVFNLRPGHVHQNQALSNLAIAYRNDDYIADLLVPAVPAPKHADIYYKFDKRNFTSYPDDALAHDGLPNQITRNLATDTYLTEDKGLADRISKNTLDNQDAVLDEFADVTSNVMEGILFKREQRVASLLTTGANYGSNTTSVTAWGNSQGDPIGDVLAAHRARWNGRGPGEINGFCSYDMYDTLARHDKLLNLFVYNGRASGLVTSQMIAQVFQLDNLYVGKARHDTANIGQAADYSRIWPDVFGIVRTMKTPSKRNASFAARFEHVKPKSVIKFEILHGVSGTWDVQVKLSDVLKILAPDTGYLLTGV